MKAFAAIHVYMRNAHHRHRMIAAFTLTTGTFVVWYVTKNDAWFKAFELSASPFVDKLIFGLAE